jgi:hypothetical protein
MPSRARQACASLTLLVGFLAMVAALAVDTTALLRPVDGRLVAPTATMSLAVPPSAL